MLVKCPSCGWNTKNGKYCKLCGEKLYPKKKKEKVFNPNENYKRPKIINKKKKKTDLTTCRTCGNDVAKSAKRCPHCGETYPNKNLYKFITIGTMIITLFFILITYFTIKTMNTQIKKTDQEMSKITKRIKQSVKEINIQTNKYKIK